MVRIIENYTLYEVIGEGAYGKVYRAVNKLDNKQYAVKVIEVKKFQSNKKLQECTVHEINILTNIEKNKHIITYYDMLKTQNNFYFVYEYCNGGTLETVLRKDQMVDEKKALLILKQLLQAFQVLNKYNIMHRDLKPDNIFFHNGDLKVGDFGFCKSLEKAEMTKTMLGSPIYMAPQILNGQIYSNKADIWSIGVVLYEMLYGFCPFESNSIPKLIQVLKETELQFPADVQVSNEVKILLKKILTKDPQKRIEWMELFQIKISPEGRLMDQQGARISLVDDKNLLKTVREISESSDQSSSPTYNHNANGNGMAKIHSPTVSSNFSTNSTYSTYSPRNLPNISMQNKVASNEQKSKTMPTMKKHQGTVQEGETVQQSVPAMRKFKSTENTNSISSGNIKDKALKFHQELVRGVNIVRSMGLNSEKATPLFSYWLLKTITDRTKAFINQNLGASVVSVEAKQIKQLFQKQTEQIDYQTVMLRNKIQDFPDWKKAIKAKINDLKNIKLVYELVMFLAEQTPNDNLSIMEMKNAIRIKSS